MYKLAATLLILSIFLIMAGCSMTNSVALQSELLPLSCNDGDSEICVVDTENNRIVQLTSNTSRDFSGEMNASGLIAYLCYEDEVSEICVINADGTGYRKLTSDGLSKGIPSVNDVGLILFSCEDDAGADHICRINADGTGFERFNVSPFNDPFAVRPRINNSGQVIFGCTKQSPLIDLCAMMADGSDVRALILDDKEENNPYLTRSGLIIYGCGVPPEQGVCTMNFDGTAQRNLTHETGWFGPIPSANDQGQIAYGCREDFSMDYNLCVINADGSGFRVMQDIEAPNGPYSVFHVAGDGLIVYGCRGYESDSLCAVNFDGSNGRFVASY